MRLTGRQSLKRSVFLQVGHGSAFFALRDERPNNPEVMRRLRLRESNHSIIQVCTKPNAAEDTQ